MTDDVKPARAAAFCPGHITGLFEIHDANPDPLRRGSRGAGFSLAQGAVTYVEVAPADSMRVEIVIDKEPQPDDGATVTRDTVITMLKEAVRDAKVPLNRDAPKGHRARIHVRVVTELQLPVSQGFGMSAAGALSSGLALGRALRMGRSEAMKAAHTAEVSNRTGLGDVVGAALGGFEMRTAPGVPPYGALTNFIGYGEAVICVVGGKLLTRDVLGDATKRQHVNEAGGRALAELQKSPMLETFLEQSQRFARESGLLTPELERAMHAASQHGHASMSMLGNSLFAFGNVPRLVDALEPFGEVRVVPVSEAGARLLEIRDDA